MPNILSSPRKTSKKLTSRKIFFTGLTSMTNEQIYVKIAKANTLKRQAQAYIENALENFSLYSIPRSYSKVLLYASMLSSQKYGPFLQKFHFANWEIESNGTVGGDGMTRRKRVVEFKASYRKSVGDKFNIVQIRLNDKVDSFVFLLIDMSITGKISHDFVILNRQQMRDEVKLLGNFAHGNSRTNIGNIHAEYRIGLKPEDTMRWINSYGKGSSVKVMKSIINR